MKELNLYYRSFDGKDEEGETQLLTLQVTDEAAETVTRALYTDMESFETEFSIQELTTLHTIQKVCEGLEQLNGKSIYRQGETRPYMYTKAGGFALVLDDVEDVTGQGLCCVNAAPGTAAIDRDQGVVLYDDPDSEEDC